MVQKIFMCYIMYHKIIDFQVWLLTNRAHIPDYADIVCDNLPYKLKVIKMSSNIKNY